MTHTIRRFPPLLADLEFDLKVPEGFVEPDLPREDVDFGDPTKSAPLTLLSSPVAMAIVTVAARPAYENGSVDDWARFLCGHYGLEIAGLVSGFCGLPGEKHHTHPCVFVEATQVQNDTHLTMRIVVVEDGGRLVTVHAMCPTELWPSFGKALEESVESISLTRPKGPTVSCVPNGPVPIHDMPGMPIGDWPQGRGAHRFDEAKAMNDFKQATNVARALIEQERFDDADLLITNLQSTVYFGVTLHKLYKDRLIAIADRDRSSAEQRAMTEEIFRRALKYALMSYPDPHTADEAERYSDGRERDRSELVSILGYQPSELIPDAS